MVQRCWRRRREPWDVSPGMARRPGSYDTCRSLVWYGRNSHPLPTLAVVWGCNMRDTPAQSPMATGRLLTVTSLLSLFFLTLHVSDDIARGISSLNFASMIAVLVAAMLLYATPTGE